MSFPLPPKSPLGYLTRSVSFRLWVHKHEIFFAVPTPETAFKQHTILIDRITYPHGSHYHSDGTHFLTELGIKEWSKELLTLRVRAYIDSVPGRYSLHVSEEHVCSTNHLQPYLFNSCPFVWSPLDSSTLTEMGGARV